MQFSAVAVGSVRKWLSPFAKKKIDQLQRFVWRPTTTNLPDLPDG